jgi:DNA repair exonuclease SbcCD ATPase subunit
MILKELELKNYKQHRHRKIQINGNLIGVIGPNGCGKSNLLGSVHYCLGGEQPGFKKEDLLCWGTDDGFTKLTVQQHENLITIRRGVGTSSAHMKVTEDEEYRGITKVNNAINVHFGLDKDLLRQAVFARQAEIDTVLFTDPRDRELAFQRLCGMGDASKIHKVLGQILTELDAIPDYGEEITEAKRRYKELTDRLKQLQSNVQQTQTARDQVPVTSDLEAQLQAYAAILPVVQRLTANLAEEVVYKAQINTAETYLALLPCGEIDLTTMEAEIQATRTALAMAQERERLETAWRDAGTALVALGDKPEPDAAPHTPEAIQELSEAYQKAHDEAQAAQAEIKLYRSFTEGTDKLEVGAECPVCGGEVKDPDHAIKRAAEAETYLYGIDEATPHSALQTAKSAVAQHEQTQQLKQSTWQTQYKHLLNTYTAADTKLKATPALVKTPVELQEMLAASEAKHSATVKDIGEISQCRAEIKAAKDNLVRLETERTDLSNRANDLPDVATALATGTAETYVAETQATQRQTLEQARQIDHQIAQLQGMITELSTATQQLDKTISELEFKQAQQSELRAVFTTLTNVRDWFHYNNGPKTLSNSILQDMTANVNDFLGQLGAPFTVTGSEDSLGFNCNFHDGRPQPPDGKIDAHHLSGGQRMQLAIAFRLASYCMFAGRLGLLSLDEPTTYLDDQNVGHFCGLLPKLKEVAKSMDLQIMIATHAKEVLPHMDTIVNLYPDD